MPSRLRRSAAPRPTDVDLAARCQRIKLLLFDCDGVLTDGSIIYSDTEELKAFHARDGIGAALATRAGLPIGCVTGRSSKALARRAGELKYALLLQGIAEKRAAVAAELATRGLAWEDLAYVGDDLNDLPVLLRAGLSLAPRDAHPEICAVVHHVLAFDGGRGAVRDAIDLILRHSGRLQAAQDSYRHEGTGHDGRN